MKNEILFQRIKKLVAIERRIGVEILECLHEIEIRKAYAELRYDGLYSYCVKELGFTDSQAYQRIQAMRALKEMPELAPKIESGALSVSAVAKVHNHFRQERKNGISRPKDEKFELFRAVEHRTIREVEAKLAEERGETLKEKLVLEMDEELFELWKEVKNLAAHRTGGFDTEVLKLLAREWLEKNDPGRKERSKERSHRETRSGKEKPRRAVPLSSRVHTRTESSRAIPAGLRREIWKRDEGRCTHCGSKHALEIDHRIPFAAGGKTELENLRLLCRSCNQFAAVRWFGAKKMETERSHHRAS